MPVHDTSKLESIMAATTREPNSGLIVMPEAFLSFIARRSHRWLLATVFQLSIRTAHSLKSAPYCLTDLTGSIIFGVRPAAPTVFSEARNLVTCRCRCRPSMSW